VLDAEEPARDWSIADGMNDGEVAVISEVSFDGGVGGMCTLEELELVRTAPSHPEGM